MKRLVSFDTESGDTVIAELWAAFLLSAPLEQPLECISPTDPVPRKQKDRYGEGEGVLTASLQSPNSFAVVPILLHQGSRHDQHLPCRIVTPCMH